MCIVLALQLSKEKNNLGSHERIHLRTDVNDYTIHRPNVLHFQQRKRQMSQNKDDKVNPHYFY